jgi:hypothetical protein
MKRIKNYSKIIAVATFSIVGLLVAGCSKDDNGSGEFAATDYSLAKHWLSLPSPVEIKHNVDVFYLYPTSWAKDTVIEPNICAIDNPIMVAYSKGAFLRQATLFDTAANVFAPYYRQADANYTFSLPEDEQHKLIGGIPATDAIAAFDYYIKNFNNGRPFILAGHSQGSNVLLFILSDYMKEHPEVYERMIAAYVIGYSVTQDYLTANNLKFAEGPDDTQVIISFNTEASNIATGNPVVKEGALVINPITWTHDETLATSDQNLGGRIADGLGKLEDPYPFMALGYANAQIDLSRGVLICSNYDPIVDIIAPGPPKSLAQGVYHSFDYMFYYYNLQQNAMNRIQEYWNKTIQ